MGLGNVEEEGDVIGVVEEDALRVQIRHRHARRGTSACRDA
jgi:hypothetical protein